MKNTTVLTVEDEQQALKDRQKRGDQAINEALLALAALTEQAAAIRMSLFVCASSAAADYYVREARDLAQRLKDLAA